MDQRPMDGAEPLPAPSLEIAQAYLDEIGVVRTRREERIDRRRIAWFALLDAVILAVYVTIAVFGLGVAQVSSSFMVFIVLFLIWGQFATERRESHGASGSRISRSRAATIGFAVILIAVVIGGFMLSASGLQLPVIVRLIPGIAVLFVLGIPAVREIRRSVPFDEPEQRRPFGTSARLATIGCGVIMAASVWAIAAADQLLMPFFGLLLIGLYSTWWIAGRISSRLPALGALWAWPQWTALALAGVAAAAVMIAQLVGVSASAFTFAPLGAGIIVLLFIGSAFLPGRDV